MVLQQNKFGALKTKFKVHLRLIHITAFSACVCGRQLRCSAPLFDVCLTGRYFVSLKMRQKR